MTKTLPDRLSDALNKVNHWGMLLAGQIAGTMQSDDPRSKGYRDLFQKNIALRVETTGLAALLIKKGVFTADEYFTQLIEEAELLDAQYARHYPFAKSTDTGLTFHDAQSAAAFMRDWPQ